MALKDLVAQKAVLTEESIEKIIGEYVRYDTDELELAFTPAAADLSNKAKVLIYLAALQGWQFVVDEAITMSAKPAELEDLLGIPGGTLRPILKDLKDGHLLKSKGGTYSVRAASLDAIKSELDGTSRTRSGPAKRKFKKPIPKSGSGQDKTKQNSEKKRKKPPSKVGEVSQQFDDWIDQGYFDKPRTAADVFQRFHDEGTIIPRSSVPQYLLGGIRSHKLSRKKEDVDGKQIYLYRTKKKNK